MVVAYWFAMMLPTMAATVRIAVRPVRTDHSRTFGLVFFTDSSPFFYNNRRSAECFTNQTQFALLDLVLTSL